MTHVHNIASIRLRFLAFVIDLFFLLSLHLLFFYYAFLQPMLSGVVWWLFVYLLVFLFNPLVYFQSVWLTHFFGGSFGKLACGLRVRDETGKQLSFKRVFFRQVIGYKFSMLVFGLGYLAVLRDKQRQAWHDKTVGSLVVVERPLWVLGIATLLCLVALVSYMFFSIFQTIFSGPLRSEADGLVKKLMETKNEERGQGTIDFTSPSPEPLDPRMQYESTSY